MWEDTDPLLLRTVQDAYAYGLCRPSCTVKCASCPPPHTESGSRMLWGNTVDYSTHLTSGGASGDLDGVERGELSRCPAASPERCDVDKIFLGRGGPASLPPRSRRSSTSPTPSRMCCAAWKASRLLDAVLEHADPNMQQCPRSPFSTYLDARRFLCTSPYSLRRPPS